MAVSHSVIGQLEFESCLNLGGGNRKQIYQKAQPGVQQWGTGLPVCTAGC